MRFERLADEVNALQVQRRVFRVRAGGVVLGTVVEAVPGRWWHAVLPDGTRTEFTLPSRAQAADWLRQAVPPCAHDWQEQPGEPPVDACSSCGAVRS